MPRSFARRRVLGALAGLGGAALVAPAGGIARAAGLPKDTGRAWPAQFRLPNGFRPEGIAIGASPYAYVGSIASGSVYKASPDTGSGRVISQGLGPEHAVIGLKIDRRERLLFLSGGFSREIRIAETEYDAVAVDQVRG